MNINKPVPRVSKQTARSLSFLLGIAITAWGLLLTPLALEAAHFRVRDDHGPIVSFAIAIFFVSVSVVLCRKAYQRLIKCRSLVGLLLVIPMVLVSFVFPPFFGLFLVMRELPSRSEISKPSISDVRSRFTVERASAEELRAMIMVDAKGKNYYQVGLDRIGRYSEFNGEWETGGSVSPRSGLSLAHVLRAEGISEERYGRYKLLFSRLKAERVTYWGGEGKPPVVRILIYRDGMVVSGSIMDLVAYETPPVPYKQPGHSREVTDLGGGWYVVYEIH